MAQKGKIALVENESLGGRISHSLCQSILHSSGFAPLIMKPSVKFQTAQSNERSVIERVEGGRCKSGNSGPKHRWWLGIERVGGAKKDEIES